MSADRRMSTRRMLGATVGVLTLLMINVGPSRAAGAGTILIYGPSLETSTPNEQTVAEGLGYTVTVASEVDWADMTTAEFAAYDAIVIGDAGCNSDDPYLSTAEATRTTWSPAVTGHITLNTFDPFAHSDEAGGQQLVANSINFAASQPGTGLFFSLGCSSEDEGDSQPLTVMDPFGTFTVDGDYGDEVTIIAPEHPVMAGLTNESAGDWGSSVHSHFLSFPASFQPLATETENVDPDRVVALALIPPTCKGKPATLFGGPAGDVIAGTAGPDVIASLNGDDVVRGGGGPDIICGGRGKDTLKGGGAKDTLLGEAGRDLLAGGGGKGDRCKGGSGKDSAKGNCERGKA